MQISRGDAVSVRDYRNGSKTYGQVIKAMYINKIPLRKIHRVLLDGDIWSVGIDRALMFVATHK